MFGHVEIEKLGVLINAANNGDQQAITDLDIFLNQVSEFEDLNKKVGDC